MADRATNLERSRLGCIAHAKHEAEVMRAAQAKLRETRYGLADTRASNRELLDLGTYHAQQARMHLHSALAAFECAQNRAEKA